MNVNRWLVCASAAGVGLLGCATPKPAVPPEQAGLAFVRDGVTTREEAILKLGEPTGTFEEGRILTWRLWADEKGMVRPSEPRRSTQTGVSVSGLSVHSLVLVFDGGNVVVRHSVVGMR